MNDLDRRIAALAIPSLGALAAEPLYVLADTAIVGHLGTDALGGLAVAGTALTALTWLVAFLSMGTTTRIATAVGAGKPHDAARAIWHAALVALVIGAVLLSALQLLTSPIVHALGGRGAGDRAAVTYLRIGSIGVPFQLLAFVGHGWWRGHSLAIRSLVVVVVANAVNIALEVLFVYGFHWGIKGSAWGTVIAQVLAAGWLAIAIGHRVRHIGASRAVDREEMRRVLAEGGRITLRTLAHVSVFVMASATAARLGKAQLGAHQIGMQLFSFLALSLDALAVPAQVFTGQAIGAGRPREAHDAVKRCLVLSVYVGIAIGAVVAGTSGVLPRVFTDDPQVAHFGVVVLVLLGVLQVPGAVAFALDGALLGAADYRALQRATTIAAATFVPIAIAVLVDHDLGIVTLWCGLLVWMTVRAALNGRRWRTHLA